MNDAFDVIVVGGGHAGCEAAAAAARLGARVALVTMEASRIGAMSCNPAIGGLGKGHLVREIDAFDGLLARAADDAAVHYRMLNRSKGSAVHGPRVQADRTRFAQSVQRQLGDYPSLKVVEGTASQLLLADKKVGGLLLANGRELRAASVVLATGTFLNGRLHIGLESDHGGRVGERSATSLGNQLRDLDLPVGRLKTGTPPRLDGRSIDWGRLEVQPSDDEHWRMSLDAPGPRLPQLFCAVTRTNNAAHRIIRNAFDESPLHSGAIEGRGPRYCPSIEDKVVRFGDRDGHQIFLEPEGLDTPLVYPNGISTSLPAEVQRKFLREIEGLERVEVVVAGYAVEYDFVDPRALDPTLEVRSLRGLFLSGQINGTTGYEEAAAQGLVAGLNAAAAALGMPPILFDRASSYIGVMIDDLTLHGVTEPYRMLTSRAEFRLRLRADNAFTRLGPQADATGALRAARRDLLQFHQAECRQAGELLSRRVSASRIREAGGSVAASEDRLLHEWLRFDEVDWTVIEAVEPDLALVSTSLRRELKDDARYRPYLDRHEADVRRAEAGSEIAVPADLDYAAIAGLSQEMIERLEAARPTTISQVGRVRGITPAAVTAVLMRVRRAAA